MGSEMCIRDRIIRVRGFQKTQLDFYERKCNGGGLGNKKWLAIYLRMVAKLISNLSVFLLGWREKDPRTDRQTVRLRIRISLAD